jgi:hypothetical protein
MSTTNTPLDFSPNSFRRLDPTKYTSLGDFINQVNKPDNRDLLVKTYGNQGITGFLQLTGAVKANGVADEVQYWEETRLHQLQVATPAASAATGATALTLNLASAATSATGATKAAGQKYLRVNDVILVGGVDRFIITALSIGSTGEFSATASAVATAIALTSGGLSASAAAAAANFPIVGNLFSQGTDQNTGYLESNVVKRTNPYMILKEVYKVTGSQATNIGWVNLGNGDYRWFIKSENDTRQRFLDKREMMMLLGQSVTNTGLTGTTGYAGLSGSEGYFSAIQDRGIVMNSGATTTAAIATLDELDGIITALDKQGSMPEYAMYVNRLQDLAIDDMIANGVGTAITAGVTTQFGQFANASDMVKLGFASFMRGSYTFHKHNWKLLNDPTLLANSAFQGVMIPLARIADPKTGDKAPALELNYKATNGYSREMEHWMTGSILGVTNTNTDALQFNYRSECALVTRAANQHVLLRS